MTGRRWADRLLANVSPTALEQVADDPPEALRAMFGITVVATSGFDSRGAGGWCDGVSLLKGNKILYRATASRRENFTLCHELGHYLAESDDDCLNWLADLAEPERTLETLCDTLAARILIPEHARATALRNGPSADALVELFEATHASRSACANVVVDALPADGFIAIIRADEPDHVFYGTRTAETRPYAWTGDPVPAGHPLARVTRSRRCHTFWPNRHGGQRNFYMSAATDGVWNIGVFSSDNIWEIAGGNFVDVGEETRRNDDTIRCPCGYQGITPMWPCSVCHLPGCPACGECQCDRDSRTLQTAMCSYCTTTVRVHLLEDGLCPACR